MNAGSWRGEGALPGTTWALLVPPQEPPQVRRALPGTPGHSWCHPRSLPRCGELSQGHLGTPGATPGASPGAESSPRDTWALLVPPQELPQVRRALPGTPGHSWCHPRSLPRCGELSQGHLGTAGATPGASPGAESSPRDNLGTPGATPGASPGAESSPRDTWALLVPPQEPPRGLPAGSAPCPALGGAGTRPLVTFWCLQRRKLPRKGPRRGERTAGEEGWQPDLSLGLCLSPQRRLCRVNLAEHPPGELRGQRGHRGAAAPAPGRVPWWPEKSDFSKENLQDFLLLGRGRLHPEVSGVALLLPAMPQFTFACFCGLHGFCKMKRKKEEAGGGQETAV
ncbi:bladder cancer associated transcript 1 isoform X1 [Haemorhous mexicanus]|nr:bladder cancer associated transcript 1 isoform X1 [Haemorhous mexicanus]XP_059723795.1 bladder cancer associated transcript 1 isoform X1 [Haemorhous mexicanus]XP_059723796.1 bladder cancer associated transcript 1 isoform X1 [Haemorhous mexicanus]XP_059723797.1 bladder cancer associated transcript 1 isoform X1 [Haemorhous mexicanus]